MESITRLKDVLKQLVLKVKYLVPLLLMSFNVYDGGNVNESLSFDIVNKEKSIGQVSINKQTDGTITTYVIKSSVEARFLMKFKAYGYETSIYENDTLVYSSIYRKINNRVKVDQVVEYKEGNYYLNNNRKVELNKPEIIQCNIVQLFFNEPIGITKVYCDKQQRFLRIKSLGGGKYKVQFNKGSYNVFYYQDGKCTYVEAIGTFYKVLLEKK